MTSRPFTKPYAMARLLQHGPLTRAEAIAITGWSERRTDHTLENLRKQREVVRVNDGRRRLYALTNTARVRAFAEGSAS